MFSTVSATEMHTAQYMTMATLALWFGLGMAPPLRPYAAAIRQVILVGYLVGCAGFIGYLAFR